MTWYEAYSDLRDQSQQPEGKRAALFVDGFNLYHPLCELGSEHLKWLDLWSLGELIVRDRQHSLVSVVYCTAFRKLSVEQTERHRAYNQALEAVGVKVLLGHYIMAESKPCQHCGATSSYPAEKQTDINLALSVFEGAMKDEYDWAYLLSADSDQAATARSFKSNFHTKKLVTVAPPNRPISKNVVNFAVGKKKLVKSDIEKCLFPQYIRTKDDKIIRRPRDYDPT